MIQNAKSSPQTISVLRLTLLNAKIGLLSFGGGVTALFYHEFVIKRPVLTEAEFFSGLTVSQILPGANVVNISVYIAQRLHGLPGAVAAVSGLIAGPFFIVIGMYLIYDRIIDLPWVAAGLDGITAAAIGLLGLLVLRGVRASRHADSILTFIATTVLVGILRLPLIPVVLCIMPVSIALAAYRLRRDV